MAVPNVEAARAYGWRGDRPAVGAPDASAGADDWLYTTFEGRGGVQRVVRKFLP